MFHNFANKLVFFFLIEFCRYPTYVGNIWESGTFIGAINFCGECCLAGNELRTEEENYEDKYGRLPIPSE
jgi:hypothetical protein